MKGKSRCLHCRKTFEWKRYGKRLEKYPNLPSFCSHNCRLNHGGTGAINLPRFKISNLTKEQKLERLKENYEKRVIRQDNCWSWNGPSDSGGYPVMGCRKECGSDRGHRASYLIHKGPIPKGMHVCHACDNPICTNPKHLWLGTHKQNNDDKIKKGRGNYNKPPHKVGSKNGSSKLTEEQVREIKILIDNGLASRYIGKKYSVSKTTILRIKNNTHWKHVT
jgi:hypothetical protein